MRDRCRLNRRERLNQERYVPLLLSDQAGGLDAMHDAGSDLAKPLITAPEGPSKQRVRLRSCYS